MTRQADKETLRLRWGTVTGWSNLQDNSIAALQKWQDLGVSESARAHPKTGAHRWAICDTIDVVAGNGGTIWHDWEGGTMTAGKAKRYIMEYRR